MGDKDFRKELIRLDHAFDDSLDKAMKDQKKERLKHRKSQRVTAEEMQHKGIAFLERSKVKPAIPE
jgi:hypothetical protein